MPNILNQEKVKEAIKNFVDMAHDEQKDSGPTISFLKGFPEKEEGYKRSIYNQAGLGIENLNSLKGDDEETIKKKYLAAIDLDNNNLLHWREKLFIKDKMKESGSVDLIYRIYTESSTQDNDKELFDEAIQCWGARFPIISFTFFLKDMRKYANVRPRNFKKRLSYIGADTKCLNKCTWQNYMKFINILTEVKNLLNESGYFDPEAELIDAHSFVWMLWKMECGDMTKDDDYENCCNILFYGVPGSGKSYKINEIIKKDDPEFKRTERIVFYPEYTYSDFVGQILPQTQNGDLSYSFVQGPFTRILKKAYEEYKKKNYSADDAEEFYLVIEEINRGNAPAIFGDIFQLLDRDENGESVYSVYNADIAREVYKDEEHEVKLPPNLKILATMNTADQNVFTLDTAFQRRWYMELVINDIKSAEHANHRIKGSNVTWAAFATTINDYILKANEGMLSSEDKRLGAYFADEDELNVNRFPQKVLKYLWDDAFRMERDFVFNKDLDSLDSVIEKYTDASENSDPIKAVFNDEVYKKMTAKDNEDQGIGSETESKDD